MLENKISTKIYDDKFNEVLLVCRIISELNSKDLTQANLLARMMESRIKSAPSKKDYQKRLDYLYGSKLRANTYILGTRLIFEVQLYGISEKFVDEQLLSLQIQFIHEVIETVLIDDKNFLEAKQNFIKDHEKEKENPSSYAFRQAVMKSSQNPRAKLTAFGQLEDLKSIDLLSLMDFHLRLLKNDAYFSIVGNLQEKSERVYPIYGKYEHKPIHIQKGKDLVEHDGGQSEVILVYDFDFEPGTVSSTIAMLFTAYLGQFPNSLLFQEIREKRGLCYSIFARRLVYDGLLVIQTSVSNDRTEDTVKAILETVELMKGELPELESIKFSVESQIVGSQEDISSISARDFNRYIQDNTTNIESLINDIRNIEENDLNIIAKKLNEPYIYIYHGKGE